MKKIIYLILIMVIGYHVSSQAQFKEWGTKLGLRYNQILPITEFNEYETLTLRDYEFSFIAQGFLAFELTPALEIQINAGYGQYAGVDFQKNKYSTDIIPIDLRFRVSPFDMKGWNPYLYAGGGIMNYTVQTKPVLTGLLGSPGKEDGWVAYFPGGIGTEILITETVLLDLGIGAAITLSDDLDGYVKTDVNDWWMNFSAGLTFTGESGSSDRDKDGLTKNEEEKLGTNPKNPDSDGDGIMDGEEVNNYKTNPLEVDSDLDALTDYNEIFVHKTNPLSADSDSDVLNDGEEINKYKTDPLVADTDNDKLPDGDEVDKYLTDPLKADMDMDGLTDGDEVLKYKTDPKKADTDGDGLTDAEEVIKHKTDPNNKDTDDGTVDDGTEIKRGTDPLNGEDDVVKVGVPIILEGITFATGKADITPESEFTLRNALKTLQTYSDIVVEISGHTDITGSYKKNMDLSQRRADSVRDWLIRNGVAPDRIFTKGYGPDQPVATNDTPEGRQKNRRIEFKRIK